MEINKLDQTTNEFKSAPVPPACKSIRNRKDLLLIILGTVVLLFIVSSVYYLGTQSGIKTSTPQQINPSPSQTIWKTSNSSFGYKVDFPYGRKFEGPFKSGYELTEFLGGCLKIYVTSQKIINNPNENIFDGVNLSSIQLYELENLQEGKIKTFPIPNWNDGSDFTYKDNYKKLPPKSISGIPWSSFDVTNNWENYGIQNMYFVKRNHYLYLIMMLSSVLCSENEPVQTLSTFQFTD